MKVQYEVMSGGELKIRDNSGRMLVLHDAYWMIVGHAPYNATYSTEAMHPKAPETKIPGRLFEELYYEIKRYHKEGLKKPGLQGYDEPLAQRLRNHIKSLEKELIDILREDDQLDLSNYLWYKELVA